MADDKEFNNIFERFTYAENARQAFDQQWRLNLAWLLSRQYTVWHKSQRRLVEPAAPPWRVRLVVNRLLPIWRSNLGRLLRTRPTPDAIPSSGDEQDVLTAKVADKLLKHIWGIEKMDGRKAIELYGWFLACGSAFTVQWWDHDAGEPIEFPELLEPEEVISSPESAVQNMGEIRVSVATPFEIYPDPAATSIEDLNGPGGWVFYAKALPAEHLKERFPKFADRISPEPNLETMISPFDANSVAGMYGGSAPAGNVQLKEHAILKEYFEAPSRKYRKGRRALIIGTTFIEKDTDLPYEHNRIPLAKFDFIAFPGRFWGSSFIEHLMPLQREYNRTRSQIIEAKNMLGKPKVFVPVTAEISVDAFTSEPGEKITYNPLGGRPEPWVPPPIPGYVIQELERTEQDMMEVSSYHWISRGMNPPGVRTASGLALLQESDDTPIGPVLQWNEASWREVGEQVVELAKQFYTEPRTVYLGLGNEAEVIEFSRTKLQGRYKVRVNAGSSLPMSRAARMQFALELLDRGAFRKENNQLDEARFFKFLEMETALDIFADDNLDIRVARTENVEMRDRLIEFDPGEYDNHPVHIDQHLRFLKELALENPNHRAKALLHKHIKTHELRIQENALKQAERDLALEAGINDVKNSLLAQVQQPQPQPAEAPAPAPEQTQLPLPPSQPAGPPMPPGLLPGAAPPGPPGGI